jgi:hypothetical protein
MADQELELGKPVVPVETIMWVAQRVTVDVENVELGAVVALEA